MVWVALGLGSNARPEDNLRACLDELLLQFRDLALSSVFRSAARDDSGPDYLNMAVGFDTDLSLAELVPLLKKIEAKLRRDRSVPKPAAVTVDIDLLAYGDKAGTFDGITLPRPEILTAAYVLWPLAQIAPKKKHPVLRKSYAELWQAFDTPTQAVPVAFEWHGRVLSHPPG